MDGTDSRFSSVAPDNLEYDSDDDDAETQEEVGTRYMRKQLRELKSNVAQPNGIIEEVVCTNFMCHAKLRITLGPLINFICGHNGSGKSAVLTALTICLGSKAASTNRGASIKDMIKEGADTATLSVKIKNMGDGAYRPDLYGRSIIVERQISRIGNASNFKLKSADGKTISIKKRDIDDMLDYYSLQLDNPINVLNQDNARQFLANSTPSDKYKFFIKGTLLESLDNDYRLIEASIDMISAKLNGMGDDIALLHSEADEASKRRNLIRQSDSVRLRVRETQRMHAWAQVEEQERILQQFVEDAIAAQGRVSEAEQTAEDASGVYEGRNQAFEQARRFQTDMQHELEPLKSVYETYRDEFDNGRLRLTELQANMRNAKTDYKSAQTRRQALQQQIDVETRNLAGAEGDLHLQRLERLKDVETRYAEAKSYREELESERFGLETAKNEAEQAVHGTKERVEESKIRAENARNSLEKLERAEGQRFAAYPAGTARLVQAIDAETRWRKKPVGPIGQLLQLKPGFEEWGPLVERQLQGYLTGFVVTSREDQRLLREISERIRVNATAYIVTPTHLDTTDKEPSNDVDTILRVLQIDDELVRNVLIIQAFIEQVVLIHDRQTGYDYLYQHQRPDKVRALVTFDDRGTGGVRFEFSRSGLQKANAVDSWRGASRMQVSREDQIRRERNARDVAENEYDSVLQEQRQLRLRAESAKQAVYRQKQTRLDAMRREQELHDEVDGIREHIEQNRPKDGRLQELQRQLHNLAEEEAGQKAIAEDLAQSRGTLDEEQLQRKRNMDEAMSRTQDHEKRLIKAQEKFTEADDKRNTALREKNRALERVKDLKREIENANKARDVQEKLVQEEFIAEAEKICPRVPVERGVTPQVLDARLERFQQDLERAQREAGGSLEQLTTDWAMKKKRLDDAVSQRNQLKHFTKVGRVDQYKAYTDTCSRLFNRPIQLESSAGSSSVGISPCERGYSSSISSLSVASEATFSLIIPTSCSTSLWSPT